jgi:hypothetical protein
MCGVSVKLTDFDKTTTSLRKNALLKALSKLQPKALPSA